MTEAISHKTSRGALIMRLITAFIVITMCVFKLALTYRGLDQPVAMDQAQIARSVAQGEGFSTKFLRPIEVMTADRLSTADKPIDYNRLRDSNHAPLNIIAIVRS